MEVDGGNGYTTMHISLMTKKKLNDTVYILLFLLRLLRAGEMTPMLRVLVAFVEKPGWVFSTHRVANISLYSRSTGSNTLFWPSWALQSHAAWIQIQAKHPYTTNKNKLA